MSKGQWTRISVRIEPFFHTGNISGAWNVVEMALRDEPLECEPESFLFLHRATALAAQYGEYALANSWVEIHKRFRQTALDDKRAATYQVIQLAIELSSKNYATVKTILQDLDWHKAPADPWVINVRLAILVRANVRQAVLEVLRRPSPEVSVTPAFRDPYDRGNRLRLLANFHFMRAEWARCPGYLRAALREYSKVKGIDARLKELEILGTSGMAAYYDGRMEEAEEHLNRAIDAAVRFKHPLLHDRFQIVLAEVYADRDEYPRVEELLLSVASRAKHREPQIDDCHFTRVKAMINVGEVALDAGEAVKAIRYLKEARGLLSERTHTRLLGYLHLLNGRLATLSRSKNRFRKALENFRQAEAFFLSLGDGDNYGLSMVSFRRAQVYLALKNIKKALSETMRCMEFAKASRHRPLQAQCLFLKSKLLLEGNLANPEGIYEELLSSIGSVRTPVMLFKIIANLYLYSWDLGDQMDLTDYHLRQIHKMSEILDRETFERLYEKHVSRRVFRRALVKTFGVDPSALEEEPE